MRRNLTLFFSSLFALMTRKPYTFQLGNRKFHLYPDGQILPAIAGGDGTDGGGDGSGSDEGGSGGEGGDEGSGDGNEGSGDQGGDGDKGDLGDAGKKAIDQERKARRDAEKRAKDAEAKVKKFENEKLDDKQKAEKRAEEAENRGKQATAKLQRANLLNALAEEGLTGPKAKAAARLLDGEVEFDDDDEPTNLKDAIEAATAEYGEDTFKGATPKEPNAPSGGADQGARDGAKKQLSSIEGMTPEEIAKATAEGRLDDYLKKPN